MMKRQQAGVWAAAVCGALWLAPAGQGVEAAGQDTVITSDRLTFDYKRSVAIFEQNVVAVDPQVRMETDMLTVFFDGSNDVKSVTAVGAVRVRSGDKTATCNKAVYIARTGEVMMTGDARLLRGKDSVSGDQITFWLNEERVQCRPGRLVIYGDPNRAAGSLLKESLIKGGTAAPAKP